jgi:hypothetical protein
MSGTVHLKPSARRVLHELQVAGPAGATTHQLGQANVGGFRFGARIHEIRGAGYRVREQRERNGSRYWLLEPGEAQRSNREAA